MLVCETCEEECEKECEARLRVAGGAWCEGGLSQATGAACARVAW